MYHKVKNFNNMFKYENFVSVKNFRKNDLRRFVYTAE